jgi:hypothetical protein
VKITAQKLTTIILVGEIEPGFPKSAFLKVLLFNLIPHLSQITRARQVPVFVWFFRLQSGFTAHYNTLNAAFQLDFYPHVLYNDGCPLFQPSAQHSFVKRHAVLPARTRFTNGSVFMDTHPKYSAFLQQYAQFNFVSVAQLDRAFAS